MKKLPIGISTFSEIITRNCYYVDKTPFVAQLEEQGKYYFLSRPRRFGKSLFIDTLAEAFSGNRELFKGLFLYDNWNWEIKYPVIRISFGAGIIKTREELDASLNFQIDRNGGQSIPLGAVNIRFQKLIDRLFVDWGQRVVVLVDEYDKPILDNITDSKAMMELREGLKNFYSVIKDSDAHVKFCLLTGVSKFSKVSIFSGLNNLEDITLDARYGSICGYTQSELEEVFATLLEGVDLAAVKVWYNGYNFMGKSVYNPFDVLLFLRNGIFHNYWFESGTPEFLIKMMMEGKTFIPSLENLAAGDELLGSFDVENIAPETLLFQTGYLTIKSFRQFGGFRSYKLGWPNLEVKASLTGAVLSNLVSSAQNKEKYRNKVFEALERTDILALRDLFHAFFASIPHDWYRKNQLAGYEGYYASIVYCYFAALGLEMAAEDATNMGKIDLWVRLENRVYIFEFKVVEMCDNVQGGSRSDGASEDAPVCSALRQLREKRYHEKFMGQPNDNGREQKIYLIGVEFSKVDRNITAFEWEKVDGICAN
ncbi:MAG: hypothetical protein CVV64_11300 [Candidatus Wallbacteria bacterium HGW-Wallbacteria-1]|uniref:AAA-ATPase-like domain-containing protein n=1 Tax=Candidatus Wallbacteria bacterium HGW-Wallbacteria-1 TaxID=2013854 RepID=A0A2N1PP24_9BACT|nr:MAG: hypothetical protein CVV64_11300 [Candidatus Wallbacteria bacterium HGW-Wallbacteria-1]